jgi:hypothetical protein
MFSPEQKKYPSVPCQFPHLFDIAPVIPPVVDRRLADQRER